MNPRGAWRQLGLAAGIFVAAVPGSPAPALAQAAGGTEAGTPAEEDRGKPLWELGMGAGVLTLPHYRGADQSHTWVLPVPYVVYRGKLLKADRDGARATLFDTERSELNLSLAAAAPTRSEDNRARQGMADLAPTLELGPVWNYTLARGEAGKLDFRWPLRSVFTVESPPRHVGWVSAPHFNLDTTVGGGWNLGLLAGPLFGDRRYHDYFYSVSGADATAARPAFRARAGYEGWQATSALSRRWGDCWLGAFVRYDQVAGSAVSASPLVRDRSQFSAGIALSWIFARSSQRVAEAP